MLPGDEELGKTELTLSAQSRPSLLSPLPLPLLYPMHQLKLSRRGPLVSTGSESGTQRRGRKRRERYSREGTSGIYGEERGGAGQGG